MRTLYLLLALMLAGDIAAQDTMIVTASTQPPPGSKYEPWRYIHNDIRRHILFEMLDIPERGFPMFAYKAIATRGADIGFGLGAWRLSDTSGVVLAWWDRVALYRKGVLLDSFPLQFIELSDEEFLSLARQIERMRAGTRITSGRGRPLRNCLVASFDERITVEACAHRITLWIDRQTPLHVHYADVKWWLAALPNWFR